MACDMKESVIQQLNALKPSSSFSSRRNAIRELFNVLESQLNAGITQSEALAVLRSNGISMTLSQFRRDLQIIRREKGVVVKPRRRKKLNLTENPIEIRNSQDKDINSSIPIDPREAIREARRKSINLDFNRPSTKKV